MLEEKNQFISSWLQYLIVEEHLTINHILLTRKYNQLNKYMIIHQPA